MGYAHSWSRVETPDRPLPPEPRDAYGRLALDTLAVIAAAEERGIALAPGLRRDTRLPPGDPWWSDTSGHRWWDACQTNRQPYDLVVCAVLIRAGTHYGPSVRISSDGGWDGTVIDGRRWAEWVPARRLVVELFGPGADRSPFPP
jgi:hypothetical protein